MAKQTLDTTALAKMPVGVLLQQLLGTDAVAAPRTTRTASAPTKRAAKTAKPATKRTNGNASNLRGRAAGVYVPAKRAKKLPDDLNPTVVKVFKFIARNAKRGITQKKLVESSDMSNSSVWNALQKLRKELKVIEYREPAAA